MLEGVVVTAAGGELHTLGGCLAASKVVGVRWSGEEASCLNKGIRGSSLSVVGRSFW